MKWTKGVARAALVSLIASGFAPGLGHTQLFAALELEPFPVVNAPGPPDGSGPHSGTLGRLGLTNRSRGHRAQPFTVLDQGLDVYGLDSERLLVLPELADRGAWSASSDQSLVAARRAAAYAIFCLERLRPDQAGTAIWCAAQDLHNRAVEQCLRLARTEHGAWRDRLAEAGIVLTASYPDWAALRFETLELVADHTWDRRVPTNRRVGLGTPLIAERRLADAELASWKTYGPRHVAFAATAVIKPHGSTADWQRQPVELVLHDPMREETVNIGGTPVLLAYELNSSLVRRLGQAAIRNYEYLGAVDPDFYSLQAGAYAIDPYQPGKIPVVLVHGLWSSPRVWAPMLAALRGDPELRASFQFWVALYPSGHPLPVAAQSLRTSLREIRTRFDRQHADRALDHMVVLGKSTGGQTVRMLAESSGDSVWNAVFAQPNEQILATALVHDKLSSAFFFSPEPYITRVIFVTTAHRGGTLARQPGVRLGVQLIRRNNPLHPVWAELEALNSRGVFQRPFQNRTLSSLDGLTAESPLLMAIDAQPISTRIAYHSIIASIGRHASPSQMTDGLVTYQSAHLDGAASERIVSATHLCEANPEVIEEVRRILRLHLYNNTNIPMTTEQKDPSSSKR